MLLPRQAVLEPYKGTGRRAKYDAHFISQTSPFLLGQSAVARASHCTVSFSSESTVVPPGTVQATGFVIGQATVVGAGAGHRTISFSRQATVVVCDQDTVTAAKKGAGTSAPSCRVKGTTTRPGQAASSAIAIAVGSPATTVFHGKSSVTSSYGVSEATGAPSCCCVKANSAAAPGAPTGGQEQLIRVGQRVRREGVRGVWQRLRQRHARVPRGVEGGVLVQHHHGDAAGAVGRRVHHQLHHLRRAVQVRSDLPSKFDELLPLQNH